LLKVLQTKREQVTTTNLALLSFPLLQGEMIMAYSDFLCDLDQDYWEFQDRISEEWRVEGESDGDEGIDPKYPSNSAYLDGYNEGHTRYINRLAGFKKPESGRLCRCGLVRAQDCYCKAVSD